MWRRVISFRAARRHTHHELHHRRPPAARRAGLRRPRRAAPPRVARPLLPPARVLRGGRGPRPGGVPARVAPARDVRGPRVGSRVAVPDRDERLPRRARQAPAAAERERRGRVAAALSRRAPRAAARPARGPGGRGARQGDRRAGVHRRDPAPRAAAAGRARAARRPRLLGEGDRAAARDDRGVGELRAAARAGWVAGEPARGPRGVATRRRADRRRAGAARPLRRVQRARRRRGPGRAHARGRPLLDAADARRLDRPKHGRAGLDRRRVRIGGVRQHAVRGHPRQRSARGRGLCAQAGRRRYEPLAIDVLRVQDGVVTEIVTFDGAVFEHFDLPATLSAAVGTR